MKRVAIPVKIRDLVAQRALYRCEYCQIHEDDHFLAFHIDHILALKHGGTDNIENLAWACPTCNTYKGTDFATFLFLDRSWFKLGDTLDKLNFLWFKKSFHFKIATK